MTLPGNWTLARLAALSSRERFRLLENARHTPMLDEASRPILVEAVVESGPIFDSSALKSADPATITMYELINSPTGVASCIAASDQGLPALAGIEPAILQALGDIYRTTFMATVEAGGLVGQMMRARGYQRAGRQAMPPGSVAKTAATWTRTR